MANIILTGGGTAGHCAPCLALIPYLKENFENIYYIGSENGIEKQLVEKHGIPYFSIPTAKLIRSFNLKNLIIPFKVFSGIKKAQKIITDVNPCVIFSKGGYVALPTVVAGKLKKVPVICHESDYTVGLANKLSAKLSKKVLTSFPETAKNIKNGEFIGSPIRNIELNKDLKSIYAKFNFSGDKPVILVTGGSQGAKEINKVIRLSLSELLPKYDIIHICGKGNLDKNLSLQGYYQTEFMHDIENAFAIADLCVSRGGSNALFELLNMEIPSVIIPLPKGISRGDQILNASYFQKLGLISVLPQEQLTVDSLIFNINSTYLNRYNLRRAFKKHPISSKSRQIADILSDYIR